MKKFAIILSGCGQHDGSETHEVILTLLSLAQEGISWEAFAPNAKQKRIVNHIDQTLLHAHERDVLEEAARLVRGNIRPLKEANLDNFDGIIFPGGVGAVNVLCNWIDDAANFEFHPEVAKFIDQAVSLKKVMGFICIAPVMIPKIFAAAKLTIGNDIELAHQIEKMGSIHIECKADDVVIDEKNKIVSTPANMVANNIQEVYVGIKKLVKEMSTLAT